MSSKGWELLCQNFSVSGEMQLPVWQKFLQSLEVWIDFLSFPREVGLLDAI